MNIDVAPPEQILKELAEIDGFLLITCSEQIEEVVQRGNDLSVHLARSGKLLADAKYHLDRKMKSEVFDTLKEAGKQAKASQTAVNRIIASLCAEEQYLVNWADRANRTATHQLDWLRSLLSKAKEEMRLTPPMYNNQRF